MDKAYRLELDGQTWLRIEAADGLDYEEPISGWHLLHVMQAATKAELGSWWRHKDGRQIKALHH